MAYSPILMDKGAPWAAIVLVWIASFIGFLAVSVALEGFLRHKPALWKGACFSWEGR